jgi:Rrf2 family nitric oxide-sensitive transcriptional repressor
VISQTAEYALRAIVHLAYHPDDPQTAQQIAVGTRVSLPYLSKVLQTLARAGIIHSQRGLHGGFSLLEDPKTLTVYTIVEAVDPIRRITSCPLGLKAHGVNLCPLHRRLDDALALVEKSFRESTIAELLAEPTSSKPLCPFPIQEPALTTKGER